MNEASGLFGHAGASGSLAWADPEHRLAFGYAPNRWAELSHPFARPVLRSDVLTRVVHECAGVRAWGLRGRRRGRMVPMHPFHRRAPRPVALRRPVP